MLDKDATAVLISLCEKIGVGDRRLSREQMKSPGYQQLLELARTHHTAAPYLIQCYRQSKGLVTFRRASPNGNKPGAINYCHNCGAHLAAVRKVTKALKHCPGCGQLV